MKVVDFRTLEITEEIETDLCIIGSGPAGLTIAGEFIGTDTRTLILESGGMSEDDVTGSLNQIDSIGQPRVMDQRLVRNRVFGGTSHSWTGRCAPFDTIDFAARPWVPHTAWPMPRAEIEPFLARACSYLGLTASHYDERLRDTTARPRPTPDINANLLKHCFWQYSTDAVQALDFMRFGPAFLAKDAPNVRVLLHATVVQVLTNHGGAEMLGLEIATPEGKRAIVRPKIAVLCAGGLENARILLYSNRGMPAGLGNAYDNVGRFMMDHPRCTLAEFDPRSSGDIRDCYGLFRLNRPGERNFFVQGLSLSPAFQERAELLNCAAWLTEDRAPDDPWDAAKRLLAGPHAHPFSDAWLIMSQPHFMLRGLKDRAFRGRGVPHKLRRLVLDCIVEQRPDPESRLTLGDRLDRLGLPLARLDWRISDQEKATVAELGHVICEEFARLGMSVPELTGWVKARRLDEARFVDVSHPTGTTRMSDDPRTGVVDGHAQVHGVQGLYVAGSSVFPTSGHANPTMMIVALAIRLADTLKGKLCYKQQRAGSKAMSTAARA